MANELDVKIRIAAEDAATAVLKKFQESLKETGDKSEKLGGSMRSVTRDLRGFLTGFGALAVINQVGGFIDTFTGGAFSRFTDGLKENIKQTFEARAAYHRYIDSLVVGQSVVTSSITLQEKLNEILGTTPTVLEKNIAQVKELDSTLKGVKDQLRLFENASRGTAKGDEVLEKAHAGLLKTIADTEALKQAALDNVRLAASQERIRKSVDAERTALEQLIESFHTFPKGSAYSLKAAEELAQTFMKMKAGGQEIPPVLQALIVELDAAGLAQNTLHNTVKLEASAQKEAAEETKRHTEELLRQHQLIASLPVVGSSFGEADINEDLDADLANADKLFEAEQARKKTEVEASIAALDEIRQATFQMSGEIEALREQELQSQLERFQTLLEADGLTKEEQIALEEFAAMRRLEIDAEVAAARLVAWEEEHEFKTEMMDSVQASLEQTLSMSLTALLEHTQSLADIGKNLIANMQAAILSSLVKIGVEKLRQLIMDKIMSKAKAVSDVTKAGAAALAGGTASMAAAPFPINLTAPGFGASMSQMALSAMPAAAAAAGGFVPMLPGANPNSDSVMAALTPGELVIPKPFAEEFPSFGGAGAQEGASGGGGGTVNAFIIPSEPTILGPLMDALSEAVERFGFRLVSSEVAA